MAVYDAGVYRLAATMIDAYNYLDDAGVALPKAERVLLSDLVEGCLSLAHALMRQGVLLWMPQAALDRCRGLLLAPSMDAREHAAFMDAMREFLVRMQEALAPAS